jgi:dTDP-4-amino-4,6-dideoxygalactose transaminase
MDRLESILAERTRLAERYGEMLRELDFVRPPTTPPDNVHGWQAYVCLFCPEEPTLERDGIATRPGTHAAAGTGYYARKYGFTRERFPAAAIAERLSLALPLYPGMTDADLERVVDALRRAAG